MKEDPGRLVRRPDDPEEDLGLLFGRQYDVE
jgi:hypothetical protein